MIFHTCLCLAYVVTSTLLDRDWYVYRNLMGPLTALDAAFLLPCLLNMSSKNMLNTSFEYVFTA